MPTRRIITTPESVTSAVTLSIGAIDSLRQILDASVTPPIGATVIVSDERVASLYLDRVRTGLGASDAAVPAFVGPPGEGSKSFERLLGIHELLRCHRVGRDGVIVAVGGGVVTDLAGFAAATWMRGIDWVAVPTTLEAQIDAGIGGKTAINIPGGKNLVGAFHPPRAVVIDPLCLRTLDPRDIRAGLAESIKHALITSEAFFAWHEQNAEAILALDDSVLAELVEQNVHVKADIVARDPFERTGERIRLNFGHTMGHAIEACCGYELRHGECVALGMLAACRISRAMGLLDQTVVDRVKALLDRFGLPTSLRCISVHPTVGDAGVVTQSTGAVVHQDAPYVDAAAIPFSRILDTITRDKKVSGKQVQWVLLESLGKTRITVDVDEGIVRNAFESIA